MRADMRQLTVLRIDAVDGSEFQMIVTLSLLRNGQVAHKCSDLEPLCFIGQACA
jgi:hypothetical protein